MATFCNVPLGPKQIVPLRVLRNMQVTRQIFDSAIGKILMPWISLGFSAALLALATEVIQIVRDASL